MNKNRFEVQTFGKESLIMRGYCEEYEPYVILLLLPTVVVIYY